MQGLSLGSWSTEVCVDPQEQLIHLCKRRCWAFVWKRRIPFQDVAAVTYSYTDWNPDSSLGQSHSAWDEFTIGIRSRSDKEWSIATFFGPGGFANEWLTPDWLDWDDYLLSPIGAQESESLQLAEVLSRLIGVKIERPRH